MKTSDLLRIPVLIIIPLLVCLSSCPPDNDTPVLPGKITGTITDAETSEPIYQAKVKVNSSDNDTTSTKTDGTYLLDGIDPGKYEIQATKYGYAGKKENNVIVNSASEEVIDFSLTKIPTINVSTDILNFGLDSTSLKFNLSKNGTGTLTYNILTSQSWITVSPSAGEVIGDTEADIITVTINRTDLQKRIYIETITVSQIISQNETQDTTITVYLNGMWLDSKYVYIVRIGTQVWMGENLNVGTRLDGAKDQIDNGIIEKYCYGDFDYNCILYGGLYQWGEMMQYNPPEDSGKLTGTTQGICPDGWHLPTWKELHTLRNCLGGYFEAGGKMKETGLAHWKSPNTGATNESGFTALPGGIRGFVGNPTGFGYIGELGFWWSTAIDVISHEKDCRGSFYLKYDITTFEWYSSGYSSGHSVRCVRNP